MSFHRRLLAVLMLFGWLFAIGHVALEHAGVADGGAHHAFSDGDDDDEHDAPSHDGDHHDHDFSSLSDAQWMKSAEHKTLVAMWVPLFDALAERLADMLREDRKPRLLRTREHAPPDERASGWLLVCQTALPVRGPSLAV